MEYQTVIKNVSGAVRGDINTVNNWQNAGGAVREFYGTETAINEVKAQFIADAIIPALDKKHQQALARELPRKGSADYVAYVANHGADLWETQNQAKKDARATAHTYFARVVKYAFPPVKSETESTPKTLETRLTDLINDAIGKCERAEAPAFDVALTLTHLRAALATINK